MSVIPKIEELSIKKPLEVSKELEFINFKVLREESEQNYLEKEFKSWIVNELDHKKDDTENHKALNKNSKRSNRKGQEKTQFRSFQNAMKVLLVFGQCIGLNPVTAVSGKTVSKVRFRIISWRFLYTSILAILQTILTLFCFNMLFHSHVSIRSLSFVSFYFTIWCTTFIFIRIATRWSIFVKEIFNCNLDEYVDVNVVRKVKIICFLSLFLASLEYVLITIARTVYIIDCKPHKYDLFEGTTRYTFPWLFEFGVPYNILMGIILQLMNIIAAFNWSYSDIFIVCMSLYLTSILDQINKKIVWAANKNYLPPSIWNTLREDYTRATHLVRMFDDVFSGLILVSFAKNLFYLLLQLFNVLANGLQPKQVPTESCPDFSHGPLRGFEYPVYLIYSLTFLFTRFLTVAIVGASVNVASLVPASVLYTIPFYAYSKEIQRFLDQVHGDLVALTGLDFFYITRDLVLPIAGTIMTYELVLLQFSSDELNKI